jgi:hypothetical protein
VVSINATPGQPYGTIRGSDLFMLKTVKPIVNQTGPAGGTYQEQPQIIVIGTSMQIGKGLSNSFIKFQFIFPTRYAKIRGCFSRHGMVMELVLYDFSAANVG